MFTGHTGYLRPMSKEVFQAYVAELKTSQALDRAYWVNPNPTAVDRAAYYARQEHVAQLRLHFYAEFEAKRLGNRDSYTATIGK